MMAFRMTNLWIILSGVFRKRLTQYEGIKKVHVVIQALHRSSSPTMRTESSRMIEPSVHRSGPPVPPVGSMR